MAHEAGGLEPPVPTPHSPLGLGMLNEKNTRSFENSDSFHTFKWSGLS